jgi:hypothetical protein
VNVTRPTCGRHRGRARRGGQRVRQQRGRPRHHAGAGRPRTHRHWPHTWPAPTTPFAAAQTPQGAAAQIVELLETERPAFRVQISDAARGFTAVKLTDGAGSAVLALTGGWVRWPPLSTPPSTAQERGQAMSENTTTTASCRLRSALAASSYEHRALTVVHRWYCGYEAPHMNLGHQGELVTDDFTMHRPPEGGLPSVQGRQAYLDSVATLPSGQRNAHHLRSLAVEHTWRGHRTGGGHPRLRDRRPGHDRRRTPALRPRTHPEPGRAPAPDQHHRRTAPPLPGDVPFQDHQPQRRAIIGAREPRIMFLEYAVHPLPHIIVRMHQGRDLRNRVMASTQVYPAAISASAPVALLRCAPASICRSSS